MSVGCVLQVIDHGYTPYLPFLSFTFPLSSKVEGLAEGCVAVRVFLRLNFVVFVRLQLFFLLKSAV